jgi:hypothetical protein
MESVAIAANNVSGLLHFLCEGGIVGSELIRAVWLFHQEKAVALVSTEAADDFFGKNYSQRIADLSDFEFQHAAPFIVITIVATREREFKRGGGRGAAPELVMRI